MPTKAELAKANSITNSQSDDVSDDLTNDTDNVPTNKDAANQAVPLQPLQIGLTSADIARDMVKKSGLKVAEQSVIIGEIDSVTLIKNEGYSFERNDKTFVVADNAYTQLTIVDLDLNTHHIACNDIFLEQIVKHLLGVNPDAKRPIENITLALARIFNVIPTGIELKVNHCIKETHGYYKKSVNKVYAYGETHLQGVKLISLLKERTVEKMRLRHERRADLQIQFSGVGQVETQDAAKMLESLS